MIAEPITLSPRMRVVAARGVEALCEERRWRLLACNARATHVHIVVSCAGAVSPERAMGSLKARMTRDLRLEGLARGGTRLWTRHGSTRWINHEPGLAAAIAYVKDWQAGTGREMLEEHRRHIREQVASLREWLDSLGLPRDGRTVVWGEGAGDRARRVGRGDEGEG